MKMLSVKQFSAELRKQREIKVSPETLLRYLREDGIPGAVKGKDASGIRDAWRIPSSSVRTFKLKERGNPLLKITDDDKEG